MRIAEVSLGKIMVCISLKRIPLYRRIKHSEAIVAHTMGVKNCSGGYKK